MLFGKRRWATEVAEAAGMETHSPAAQAVVRLLVVGAKQAQRMTRNAGPRGDMDDLDFVLMCARALPDNPAAVTRAEKDLGLPQGEGRTTLAGVAAAAVRLYQSNGRELGAPRPGRMREPWSPPTR